LRYVATFALCLAMPFAALADPLPSWQPTPTEAAIVDFVNRVTDPGSADFVPEQDRIAVFDNDGTLWSEQPMYFQGLFALDRLREKARSDPSILASDALRAANAGDLEAVMASGQEGLVEILDVSHADVPVEEFKAGAHEWLTTAKHPTTGLAYAGMTYQPMLELLVFLRDEGFRTYIVSGGGVDFMRSISAEAYGIPTWQVIGSEGATTYDGTGETPVLIKDGGVAFVDDKAGKPVGIDRFIGQRPIFAAGNSDGDFQMLEYVTAGEGPRFGMIVHHTDAAREFAYDRDSAFGRLSEALDAAPDRGWVVVDMAADWSRIWTGAE
jgi:phosphoserine phosphatase